jgi:hypothetical protein
VVPANPKKPVLLLTAALVALALGVAGICGVMWKSTHGSAVVSGGAPVVPLGPGVEQTAGANAPVGAPLTATQGAPVPAGSPVTASAKKPDDGMAPSVLASGATNPRGGSGVTTVQGVPTPNGPAVVSAAPPAQQPGAPVTAARPPAPPDNSDFDRYLRWLQYVEQERERLRAMGETESFRMIDGFYQTMFSLADPDSNDAQVQQQFNQNLQGSLQRSLQTIRAFRQNVMKTKPPVPPDCGALDRYYMAAVDEESQQTVALMDALGRKDIGQVKAIGKAGVRNIDRNLGMANKELEKAYRGRGLNQQFTIDTGSGSSMLGGMIGLGGVH